MIQFQQNLSITRITVNSKPKESQTMSTCTYPTSDKLVQ